jgi:uncharacterized membrane protein YkoI
MKTSLRLTVLALFFLIGGTLAGVSAQERSSSKLAGQAKISMDEARKTALERVPGTVESSELEKEHGKLVYSFDIRTAEGITEVWVDAKSGEVINMEKETAAQEAAEKHKDKAKQKTEDDDDEESDASQKANQAKYAKEAKITMDAAKAIALREKPGTITDQELEKEHGKLLYSFDVRDASGKVFDVEIDAKTGKVLKVVEDKEDDQDDDN